MKTVMMVLLLFAGAPLPFVEAAPSVEEDAVVEVSKPVRRCTRVERLKRLILPPTVPNPTCLEFEAPIRAESTRQSTALSPRPPPAV